MRLLPLSALMLAGALLIHCRHGAGAGGAPAAASRIEPLELSALGDLRDKRLDQLRVSANGALLFTRWALSDGGFDYRVVQLPDGQPVWSWQGTLQNQLWQLALSPDGPIGFVFLPLGPEAPFIIFRASGAPIPMTDVEFTGGAWASGSHWFGGSSGAYNADGTLRGKPVPDWLKVKDELFMPGSRPETLRYMHAGNVMEWDGRSTPTVVGSWQCAPQVEQHRLSPLEPLRFSSDGRYVAWTLKASKALTVCDGESGLDFEISPNPAPAAWADNRHLWWLDAGALLGMNVLTREALPRIPLPEGEKAVSLAASIQPPALFVGTEQGHLLRIPLSH
ncbi:hypothetical protein [Stigmatella aurantiaca]|uniref:WD40-like Beta Propeller Repeat n=2 Tax=Stigmatella aurantiaca (strain DW4/3-1) TaxID=378806 RepID=E3FP45_STIAD|nr:hypothetical protein [Stigmatella aurantiaca]ADO70663.1 uncharacterized protein STAUR_2871 [Stigmatella aurantiaca DW4/3-1]